VEYAKKLNRKHQRDLVFRLVTNLSLMDDAKLDYLIEEGVGICTSLDGSRKLQEKNRNSLCKESSYDIAVKWLRRIDSEYKKRNVQDRVINALVTITRHSLPYWKEIIDEYAEVGFRQIHLRFLNNLGDARPLWSEISYTPEEFIDFWKKSVDYLIKRNNEGIRLKEWLVWIMLRKIINMEEPNYLEMRSPCGAAIGQLAYNYNGDMYTCDEARMVGGDIFRLGNVKNSSYKQIGTSNKVCNILASSVNDTQICDACVYKPFCGICPVCNYAEQGSIIGKITETARCKIYKAQFDYIFSKLKNDDDAKRVFMNWLDNP
jgi:radical SAM protein with 4Fe4S-binding SPASM domain